jgi:hypothetical protein
MQHQQIDMDSKASERFRGWRATESAGASPHRRRLRVEGEYRLEPGSGGRKLERRIAEDIDPSLFTVHIGHADGAGGDGWISLEGEFNAGRDVDYVVLKDEAGSFQVRVQRG